jgi:hypothetical protein
MHFVPHCILRFTFTFACSSIGVTFYVTIQHNKDLTCQNMNILTQHFTATKGCFKPLLNDKQNYSAMKSRLVLDSFIPIIKNH